MRIRLISPLILATLLGLAGGTSAHIGDEIDLTDGSVDDWHEVIGEPSLTASDFFWEGQPYDPSDLDFRIWLAWHQGTSTLWIAMERFDDLYVNYYDGDEPWEMQLWDSSLRFMVDGDHTGGEYSHFLGRYCELCTAEQVLEDQRQAQEWMAIAETPDGEHLFHFGASKWVAGEPYAAAGGGAIGQTPTITVTEVRVTSFDDLIYDDEDASEASRLYPGKTIGLEIVTYDNDDPGHEDGPRQWNRLSLTGSTRGRRDADFLFDGLLVGVGDDPSRYDDASAVEPSSWGRIKAALRVRP